MSIDITGFEDDQSPQTGPLSSGATTDDLSPQVLGTITVPLDTSAGESVVVFRDDVRLGTANVTDTTWAYQDSGLANGTHTYTAQVLNATGAPIATSGAATLITTSGDAAKAPTNEVATVTDEATTGTGEAATATNEATTGTTTEVTTAIDDATTGTDGAAPPTASPPTATAPAATEGAPAQRVTIAAVEDNLAPVTGHIVNGSTTNDDTPTFTGTLSAGLASGQSVHIFRDGEDVGTARVSGTNWTYEDGGLQSGETYAYTAKVVDKSGAAGPASESISFTLDTSQPPAGLEIEHIIDDVLPVVGDIPNNGVTNDTSPLLTGSLAGRLGTGDKVQVLRDGAVLGDATVPAKGTTWSYQDSGLALGNGQTAYTYTARVVDADGKVVTESSPWKISIDTEPPPAKALIDSFEDDHPPLTGVFHSGDSTDDVTPLLQGHIDGTLGPREVVTLYRGDIKIASIPVNADGTWSYQDSGLRDGESYTYKARVEDAAGNQGPASDPFTITIDTTPPVAIATISSIEDDTGAPGDFITRDATLVVNATVDKPIKADETVQISLDNGKTWHDATPKGDGYQYDATSTPLDEGTYTFQAQVIDKAGNHSDPTSQEVIIKLAPTTAAPIGSVIDDVDPITGELHSGAVTDDAKPLLQGPMLGEDGKSAALDPGDAVYIYDGDKLLGSTATVTDGNWSYQVETDLSEGEHSLKAVVGDTVGNQGAMSDAFKIIVDTTAPNAPAIGDVMDGMPDLMGYMGKIENGFTNDQHPEITGSGAEVGGTVFVYSDNSGTHTLLGTTTAEPDGSWSFIPSLGSPLPLGKNVITATCRDEAGNESKPSDAFNVMVDVAAPTHGVTIEVYDNVGNPSTTPSVLVPNSYYTDTPKLSSTNDTTPEIKGTITQPLRADHGDEVIVYRDGEILGTATVDGTNWTFQDRGLVDGVSYNYWARVVSGAGVGGAQSIKYQITIDTTAPGQPPQITGIWDDQAPNVHTVANGGITDDLTPEVRGQLLANPDSGDSLVIYRNDVEIGRIDLDPMGAWPWSFTDNTGGLVEGQTYVYTARVMDLAGNQSDPSLPYSIKIGTDSASNPPINTPDDTTPPGGDTGGGATPGSTTPGGTDTGNGGTGTDTGNGGTGTDTGNGGTGTDTGNGGTGTDTGNGGTGTDTGNGGTGTDTGNGGTGTDTGNGGTGTGTGNGGTGTDTGNGGTGTDTGNGGTGTDTGNGGTGTDTGNGGTGTDTGNGGTGTDTGNGGTGTDTGNGGTGTDTGNGGTGTGTGGNTGGTGTTHDLSLTELLDIMAKPETPELKSALNTLNTDLKAVSPLLSLNLLKIYAQENPDLVTSYLHDSLEDFVTKASESTPEQVTDMLTPLTNNVPNPVLGADFQHASVLLMEQHSTMLHMV